MLGLEPNYAEATIKSRFGKVSANFTVDEIKCKGTEETLDDCPYRTIEDCDENEGAGVICHGMIV